MDLAALKGHAATCQVLVEAGADAAIRSQYYKGEFKDDETAKEEQEGATALQIAEKKFVKDGWLIESNSRWSSIGFTRLTMLYAGIPGTRSASPTLTS